MTAERKKRIGYVVIDELGHPLSTGKYDDGPVILWSGDAATVFASRSGAMRAVKRSREYAQQHKYAWGVDRWRIWPLETSR